MKSIIFLSAFMIAATCAKAQSIIGTWQLIKQTTCLEENMPPVDETTDRLLYDMDGLSSRTPRVIEFKENNTGVESIRLIDHKKSSGSSSFLYKISDSTLYMLDKKSHTIKDTFVIEKLAQDSLIFSSSSRPCEVKIFLRIK